MLFLRLLKIDLTYKLKASFQFVYNFTTITKMYGIYFLNGLSCNDLFTRQPELLLRVRNHSDLSRTRSVTERIRSSAFSKNRKRSHDNFERDHYPESNVKGGRMFKRQKTRRSTSKCMNQPPISRAPTSVVEDVVNGSFNLLIHEDSSWKLAQELAMNENCQFKNNE